MDAAARQTLAFATWWFELLTLLLTALYCAIFGHDLRQGDALGRVTSSSWFTGGFCNSWEGTPYSSHSLCFLADVVCGNLLLWANVARLRRWPRTNMKVATAVSAFTVLHGLGHFVIGNVLEKDFMATVRPAQLSPPHLAACFCAAAALLALGPFLGYCNGVNLHLCVGVHMLASWAFLEFVPTHFTFGFVQLYLNAWYCAPRVLLVGCTVPEEVALRVDDGWAVVSAGFLLLMPIEFAEMLGCDAFFKSLSGHFLYDGAIVLISTAYSLCIWHQCKAASVPSWTMAWSPEPLRSPPDVAKLL